MDVTLFTRENDFTVEIVLTSFHKTKERKKKVEGQFASQQIISGTFLCNSSLPSGYLSDEHASPFRHKKNQTSQCFRWYLFKSHLIEKHA